MIRHPFGFVNLIVTISWLIFIFYWAVSAIGAKKNVAGKGSWRRWVLARFGIVLILFFVYKAPTFSAFWDFAFGLSFFYNGAVRIIGAILTALGIAFAVWARRHLGSNWSGRATMKIGHELVISGPYRFVRHPIYTGLLTALLGSGLVDGPVAMVVLLVFALIFIWRIRVEEIYMMQLFPDQYPAYRAGTRALIPFVW